MKWNLRQLRLKQSGPRYSAFRSIALHEAFLRRMPISAEGIGAKELAVWACEDDEHDF